MSKKEMDIEEKPVKAMDEEDIQMFKRLGYGPYTQKLKDIETQNKDLVEEIKKLIGVKDSDTGLALPSHWNLAEDA